MSTCRRRRSWRSAPKRKRAGLRLKRAGPKRRKRKMCGCAPNWTGCGRRQATEQVNIVARAHLHAASAIIGTGIETERGLSKIRSAPAFLLFLDDGGGVEDGRVAGALADAPLDLLHQLLVVLQELAGVLAALSEPGFAVGEVGA